MKTRQLLQETKTERHRKRSPEERRSKRNGNGNDCRQKPLRSRHFNLSRALPRALRCQCVKSRGFKDDYNRVKFFTSLSVIVSLQGRAKFLLLQVYPLILLATLFELNLSSSNKFSERDSHLPVYRRLKERFPACNGNPHFCYLPKTSDKVEGYTKSLYSAKPCLVERNVAFI